MSILGMVGLWAGGLVVGSIAGNIIPKYWRKFSVYLRKEAKEKAAEYLKDPEVRAWASQGIALAQKKASSDKNINKLRLAANYIKAKIKGPIDDPIVDAIVEMIIEDLKKPVDLR